MKAVHSPPPGTSVQASVTTTVVLPPDAVTIVAPHPEMISQLNVEHVLGLSARIYLELLREASCPIAVTPVGKLRLVDRNHFTHWLRQRGKTKRATTTTEKMAPNDEDQLPLAEQVKLGIKLAPRAPGRR